MLISIYILMAVLAVLFSILSIYIPYSVFTDKKVYIFAWLAVIFSLSLALSSVQIETTYCDTVVSQTNTSVANLTQYENLWTCTLNSYESIPLLYLWAGFGMIMFLYAVVMTFFSSVEELRKVSQKAEK